jgi:hypothetical protein
LKILKGLFVVISILCIAFTLFFVYSYATGHTAPLAVMGKSIAKVAGQNTTTTSTSSAASSSTVSMLTEEYGLSSSQASQAVSIAEELGVDTSSPTQVNSFIQKNEGNADEIQSIAAAVQSGKMSETEAKIKLASILNV